MAQETVLVVDDNRANRRLAEVLLSKAGYQVRVASDASEAEQSVKEFEPHLILMDVQLADEDGLELTRRLREDPATKDTVIIAFTANNAEGEAQKAKVAGCDGFIAKPVDARTFADQIRCYLEPDGPAISVDPSVVPVELRREFVTEGHARAKAWAEMDAGSLELDTVRREVHHWVGIGGTLGYPEITAQARELQAVLETAPEKAQFGGIRDLFAALLGAGFEPAVEAVVAVARKAGVFGFDEQEFGRIRNEFEKQNVAASDLGMMTEGLSGEFFATHDVIVLNAQGEAGTRAWSSMFGRKDFTKPVVVIAALGEVKNLNPISKGRPAEFVFSPWEAEEIVFRSGRLLGDDAPPPVSRRMVIIADDDPMVHTLLVAAFSKVNVECRSVHDGREALDAFRNSTPAAGILDIGMPRISGLTVLTELRKSAQTRGIPIMMLTARKQKSEVSMALGFGANDYVVKPFDPANVVTRLLRLMA